MNKNLPIFDIVLNEEDLEQGVGMISLVDEPAIGVDWIKLAKENVVKMNFSADKDKKMLYGPFLIPNMLIYRRNEKMGEFYIRFKKEEIEKISSKFNSDLNAKNINFMHTDKKVDGFVAENWIIEDGVDKSQKFGFHLPEGTWFGGVKIMDEDFWVNSVKTDEVKGFSVEILADSQLALKNIQNKMEKEIKLGSATLKDGVQVWWDGEFGMGTAIFMDEAMTQPAPDGEHTLEDGTIIRTESGLVAEIKVAEIEEGEGDMNDSAVNSASLSAAEVSQMIDARFAELMNEITALKGLIEPIKEENNNYKSQIENFKAEINEKLASTPAVNSVKKDVYVPKIATDFENQLKKVKAFAGK